MILGNPIIIPRTGGGGMPWSQAELTSFTGTGTTSETITLVNPLSVRPDICYIWKDGDIGGISENSQGIMAVTIYFSSYQDAVISGRGISWGTYPSASSSYAEGGVLTGETYNGTTKVYTGTTPANRKFVSGATYKCLWVKI